MKSWKKIVLVVLCIAVVAIGYQLYTKDNTKKEVATEHVNKVSSGSKSASDTDESGTKDTSKNMTSDQIYGKYFADKVMADNQSPKEVYKAFSKSDGEISLSGFYQTPTGDWLGEQGGALQNVKFSMSDGEIVATGQPYKKDDNNSSTLHILINGNDVQIKEFSGREFTLQNMSSAEFQKENSKSNNSNDSDSNKDDGKNSKSSSSADSDNNAAIQQMRGLINSAGGDNSAVSDQQLADFFKSHPDVMGEDGESAFDSLKSAFPSIGGDAKNIEN